VETVAAFVAVTAAAATATISTTRHCHKFILSAALMVVIGTTAG
jgi:hypothetical protein